MMVFPMQCSKETCKRQAALNESLEAEVVNLSEELVLAKAAIARVRDVYEDYFHDRSDLDAVESLEAIRRALEGDNDE